ncbi:MAG: sulfatase [Acidobacteria bacterium]|nr:sulfatase [Acidobacteriota bacterium]
MANATVSRRGALAALGGMPSVLAAQTGRGPRYNVLFLAVDDLRPELGCYGNTLIHSPNIDRLASRGLVFQRAYCQQAVCSPSRTSLLTGLRPDTTRVYELQTHFRKNLPGAVTLPEQFRKNGYATTGLSKIFHGGLDDAQSWSIPSWVPNGPAWGSPENAARFERMAASLRERGLRNQPASQASRGPSWEAPDVADNALADGKTADTAIAALRKLRGQPFFLAAGFLKPHLPFIAPKRYYDLYKDAKFKLAPNPFPPRNVPPVALHNFGELRSYSDIPKEGPVSGEKALELIRGYYAAASYTDAQIGRVIGELERLKLGDSTIVILWGDHGWHLGEHGLWNKHTNFEIAARAPLMISVPGQRSAGRKSAALVEFVDIYPTLCELCGVPVPGQLEGTSFAPLVDNPGREWKTAAFSQYPRAVPGVGQAMGHSMRTDRYRYTEWRVPAKDWLAVELYDYQNDPLGNVNIAGEPGQAALVRRLSRMLEDGWKAARPKALS